MDSKVSPLSIQEDFASSIASQYLSGSCRKNFIHGLTAMVFSFEVIKQVRILNRAVKVLCIMIPEEAVALQTSLRIHNFPQKVPAIAEVLCANCPYYRMVKNKMSVRPFFYNIILVNPDLLSRMDYNEARARWLLPCLRLHRISV